jgi:hypothetical protein
MATASKRCLTARGPSSGSWGPMILGLGFLSSVEAELISKRLVPKETVTERALVVEDQC